MADEATINSSLQIIKGTTLEYRSLPGSFTADVAGTNGPSPGSFTVSSASTGTSPDLSQFTTPGYVRFRNLDPTNFVEIGLLISATFQQLFEMLPGETYVMRFSRNITDAEVRFFADTADCIISVEALEK